MTQRTKRHRRAVRVGAAIAVTVALAACDLSVTNPGPIQDKFLNDPQAFDAVLNGAKRNVARAITRLGFDGDIVAGEITAGGLQDAQLIQGHLTSRNSDGNWQLMQEGRWVSEDGVRRLREVLSADDFAHSEIAAGLLLQAAYANRVLGENMCTAVFDGGPAEDFTVYFQRAEDQFTEALAIAQAIGKQDMAYGALAGRATARIWLNDWDGALADAKQVPTDYAFQEAYYDLDLQFGDANEYRFRQAGVPWHDWTVWDTFAEDYYTQTGDARVAWEKDPDNPITLVYNHPFYVQLKYPELTSPINLASGREMRLLEAEYDLRKGNVAPAMTLINQIRTSVVSDENGQPLAAYTGTTLEDAWTALKAERKYELWLEGRRLPDLRRWTADNTPGAMEDMAGKSLCFPVGVTEVNTNTHGLTEVN